MKMKNKLKNYCDAVLALDQLRQLAIKNSKSNVCVYMQELPVCVGDDLNTCVDVEYNKDKGRIVSITTFNIFGDISETFNY